MIEITEKNIDLIEMYAEVSEAKLRHYFEPHGGVFIAESPAVILAALEAGMEPISLLIPKSDMDGAAQLIKRVGDKPVFVAEKGFLENLRGFSLIRGAMCAMHRPKLMEADKLLDGSRRIAVLERVENPTNVGAIMRSAAALGMDAVLLTKDCSDPLYRRAARVSMGTVFQIPWTYLDDNYIEKLKKRNFVAVAMALCENSCRLDDPKLQGVEKMAIILGSEGYGMNPETIKKCDYTVKIPMHYGVDSLNVAAASALAFWQLGERA